MQHKRLWPGLFCALAGLFLASPGDAQTTWRKPVKINRSPSPLVKLAHFDAAHHHVSPPADMDADFAVLENASDRAIVAVTAIWEYVNLAGEPQKIVLTSDAYSGATSPQIAAPHSITFVGQRQVIPELTARHVARGGSYVGPTKQADLPGEATLTIDAVIFEDGEIVGPDFEQLAIQLPARKTAAARVASALRQARMNNADIVQAMDALATERPEPTPESVMEYNFRMRWATSVKQMYPAGADNSFGDAFLKHLESMPVPVKTFRKQQNQLNKETNTL